MRADRIKVDDCKCIYLLNTRGVLAQSETPLLLPQIPNTDINFVKNGKLGFQE